MTLAIFSGFPKLAVVLGLAACPGAEAQRPAPTSTSVNGGELHSIEGLCGASLIKSSVTHNDDAQACSQLRSIAPFNTGLGCPAQIFLRHVQDHTEPLTGLVPTPE